MESIPQKDRQPAGQSSWRPFLQRWIINTLSVLIAVSMVKGIHFQNWPDLLIASLVLGILNAVVRPLLMLFSVTLLIFTLGLFMLVINAATLWLAGWLLSPRFVVADFWSAFWGALIIGISNVILGVVTGSGRTKIQVQASTSGRRPPPQDPGAGSGPVIDV